MKEISVIIPVFNVGAALARTLENIVDGQFANCPPDYWEIIAVDDGSTDNSREIIESFAARYPDNIIALHQANAGVSAARNRGIEQASGRFLFFMDADDLLLRNALPQLAELMTREELDLVRFGFQRISTEEFQTMTPEVLAAPDYQKIEPVEFLESTRGMLDFRGLWSACLSMFSAEFVASAGLRFIPGLHIGEDCIFVWEVMLRHPRMAVVDADIYLYHIYNSSATTLATAAHLQRRAYSLRQLVDRQAALLKRVGGRTAEGLQESMTYNLQDLITAEIALNKPFSAIRRLTDEFLGLGGKIDPKARPFIHPRARYSLITRLKAAYFTRRCSK